EGAAQGRPARSRARGRGGGRHGRRPARVPAFIACANPTNFSFKPRSAILARLDRAQIGDFDAPVLGLSSSANLKAKSSSRISVFMAATRTRRSYVRTGSLPA